MSVIVVGTPAPPIPGVDLTGPRAVLFYKVTCPVCQMVAPLAERLEQAFPGVIAAVGQDPPDKLGRFGDRYGWSFSSTPDLPPYDASEAYGIRVVPTVVVVDRGTVIDVVESWDRDGWNGLGSRLAGLTGGSSITLSEEGDRLPSFRPG